MIYSKKANVLDRSSWILSALIQTLNCPKRITMTFFKPIKHTPYILNSGIGEVMFYTI